MFCYFHHHPLLCISLKFPSISLTLYINMKIYYVLHYELIIDLICEQSNITQCKWVLQAVLKRCIALQKNTEKILCVPMNIWVVCPNCRVKLAKTCSVLLILYTLYRVSCSFYYIFSRDVFHYTFLKINKTQMPIFNFKTLPKNIGFVLDFMYPVLGPNKKLWDITEKKVISH